MRPARVLAVLPVLVLAACLGEAFALVGAEAKLWRPEVETKVKSSTSALEGTSFSLEDDVDMESQEDIIGYRIWVGGSQRVTFSYTRFKFTGKDYPDVEIDFHGETFVVTDKVESTVEAEVYRIAWEADWWHTELFSLGTIAGTEIFDTKVTLSNDLVGKEEAGIRVPVPILGVQGEIGLPAGLAVYGEVAGLYVGYADFEGGFIEWEVGVKLKLFQGRVYASAGYREVDVDLEKDDSRAKLDVKGFTFAVGASF